jgi:hypothetical protein
MSKNSSENFFQKDPYPAQKMHFESVYHVVVTMDLCSIKITQVQISITDVYGLTPEQKRLPKRKVQTRPSHVHLLDFRMGKLESMRHGPFFCPLQKLL